MMVQKFLNSDKLCKAREKVLSFFAGNGSFLYFLPNQQGSYELFITDNIHLCLSKMCDFMYPVIKYLRTAFCYTHYHLCVLFATTKISVIYQENVETTYDKSKYISTIVAVDKLQISD